MEKYQISKISKILGIAPETLRYYEKKKIINPQKESKNSYRSFSMNDLCILSKVRSFMKYGFTLEEANQIVHSASVDDTRELLMDKASLLEKEIHQKLESMHSLYERVSKIQTAEKRVQRFELVECEDFYALKLFNQEFELNQDSPFITNWINQSNTYPYTIINGETFINGHFDVSEMGQCVEKKDIGNDLLINDSIHIIKKRKCLVTADYITDEELPIILNSIRLYCVNHSLRICGDIFTRTIGTFYQNNKMVYLSEYWVPVEEV